MEGDVDPNQTILYKYTHMQGDVEGQGERVWGLPGRFIQSGAFLRTNTAYHPTVPCFRPSWAEGIAPASNIRRTLAVQHK